jgi:hypothetical protein
MLIILDNGEFGQLEERGAITMMMTLMGRVMNLKEQANCT